MSRSAVNGRSIPRSARFGVSNRLDEHRPFRDADITGARRIPYAPLRVGIRAAKRQTASGRRAVQAPLIADLVDAGDETWIARQVDQRLRATLIAVPVIGCVLLFPHDGRRLARLLRIAIARCGLEESSDGFRLVEPGPDERARARKCAVETFAQPLEFGKIRSRRRGVDAAVRDELLPRHA